MSLFDKFKKKFEKRQKKTTAISVSDGGSKQQKDDNQKKISESKSIRKETKKERKDEKIQVKDKTGIAAEVLIRPLNTEKSAYLMEKNQYVFEVSANASKVAIKHAIRHLYGVVPEKVRIINVKGKQVTFRRSRGKRKDWKKAIVILKKGDKIEVFEGV